MNGGLHFVLAELFEEVLPRLHRTRGPVCTGMRARASSPHVPVGGHARTHILSRARGHARTRILSRARGMPVRAAQVLLCFTRDPVVAQRSAHPRPTPLVSRNRANQRAAFPPNEVPPGRGLAARGWGSGFPRPRSPASETRAARASPSARSCG